MYCHPLPPLPCATQKRVTVTSNKTRGIKRKNLFAGKYFICITRWRHRTSAQRIYILIIKVNKLFSFFSSWCFKRNRQMYFVFISSYTNTRESFKFGSENSKKLWKHKQQASVPTAFLVLPNFHSCLYSSIETRYMFSISQLLLS